MIPAGYLAKQVAVRPEWIKNTNVVDIYSAGSCVSENFYEIRNRKNNIFSLFDEPDIIRQMARDESVDLSRMKFFYYEVYNEEYDEDTEQWSSFEAELPVPLNVKEPAQKTLHGFDLVSFRNHGVECCPLSCNSMADKLPVNSHCLLSSLEKAKKALQSGAIKNCEPGPHRIFAVYTFPEA